MDPIRTAEILSETDDFFYSPYTYGFSKKADNLPPNSKDIAKKIINIIDLFSQK